MKENGSKTKNYAIKTNGFGSDVIRVRYFFFFFYKAHHGLAIFTIMSIKLHLF